MSALAGLLAQAQSRSEDILSRLLGIDRINLSDGEVALDWRHPLPMWVILLVVVPLVAGLVWFLYRRERKDVGVAPKLVLTGLRTALLLIVFLLLLGPVLSVDIIKTRKTYILALVDESLSMRKIDLPNRAEEKLTLARATGLVPLDAKDVDPRIEEHLKKLTRADVIKRVFEDPQRNLLDEIEAKLNVAYFTFSKGARAMESREKFLEHYGSGNAVGSETAIGDSIQQAMGMFRGQHVGAVVVFSDGRNNFGVDPVASADQLRQRYVSIYTVLAGIPQKERNIALIELEAQQAVLVNDKLQVRYGLKAKGYSGETVDVNLHAHKLKDPTKDVDPKEIETYLQESALDQSQKLTLDGSERQTGTLEWTPKEPGEYLLILRVPPRTDEQTDLDNTLLHRVRVADDKIKVLFVEHPPRYEYRYLKNALIRDNKILVHVLLTSADEDFPQEHTQGASDADFKTPIREFPKTLKDLLKYDVIILGDVDPQKLGGRETWENIEKFVSNFGGGLVFISGEMYNPQSYKGTPLERMLPVIPEDARATEAYESNYGYKLTPEALDAKEGRSGVHPIVSFPSLGSEVNKIVEIWEDRDGRGDGLPGVRWFQRVSKVKPGGKVLVELTGVQNVEKRPPLFVAAHYGDGRVLWSATDETWLWRYLRGDSPWFYPFWQQAMYWTRYGKLLGAKRFRLRLDSHDRRYATGEPVKFYVTAYDKNFEPLTDPKLDVFIEPPSGGRITLQLDLERERKGFYEGAFSPDQVGMYRAWAGEADDETTRTIEKFSVYIPNREEDQPTLAPDELRKLAHASHPPGAGPDHEENVCPNFFPIENIGALPDALKEDKRTLSERKEDDLWDSPAVYLLFGLLITAEWILRKVFRML